MAKLWNKFLVIRRDGSVPDWPWLVMGARDPIAPAALRAYAQEARRLGYDSEYADDIDRLAQEWEQYRAQHGDGDPDATRHREDDPSIVARIDAAPGSTVNHRRRK
jgi:hypothetical protein